MAKSSTFVADAKRIEALIEKYAQSGPGRHKLGVPLRIALLKAIACWDIDKPKVPEKLKTLRFGWGKFEKEHADRIAYLAMALYFLYCRGFSKGRAASLADIPLGDVDYAVGLVKRTKLSVAQLCDDLGSNIPLKSAVDAYFEDLVVSARGSTDSSCAALAASIVGAAE